MKKWLFNFFFNSPLRNEAKHLNHLQVLLKSAAAYKAKMLPASLSLFLSQSRLISRQYPDLFDLSYELKNWRSPFDSADITTDLWDGHKLILSALPVWILGNLLIFPILLIRVEMGTMSPAEIIAAMLVLNATAFALVSKIFNPYKMWAAKKATRRLREDLRTCFQDFFIHSYRGLREHFLKYPIRDEDRQQHIAFFESNGLALGADSYDQYKEFVAFATQNPKLTWQSNLELMTHYQSQYASYVKTMPLGLLILLVAAIEFDIKQSSMSKSLAILDQTKVLTLQPMLD